MAKHLQQNLFSTARVSSETLLRFGITTNNHILALQHAWYCGMNFYHLDRIMDDGPAITQLVASIPENPDVPIDFTTPIEFRTPCDQLLSAA